MTEEGKNKNTKDIPSDACEQQSKWSHMHFNIYAFKDSIL